MTPPSLQVLLPTQDSDRRDKKYLFMVHKVTESDTSYLAQQRLGLGLLEYTVGGRSPSPAIDELPRAAQAAQCVCALCAWDLIILAFIRRKGEVEERPTQGSSHSHPLVPLRAWQSAVSPSSADAVVNAHPFAISCTPAS